MNTMNKITVITATLALSFLAMPVPALFAEGEAVPTAPAPQPIAEVQAQQSVPQPPSPPPAVGPELPQVVEQGNRPIENPTLILEGGQEVTVYTSVDDLPNPSITGEVLYHDENSGEDFYLVRTDDPDPDKREIIGVIPRDFFEDGVNRQLNPPLDPPIIASLSETDSVEGGKAP